MDDFDGAVLTAADPFTRHSWLGLSFQLSVLPTLLVDAELEVAAANPAAEQLFGAEPVLGRSVTDFRRLDPSPESGGRSACWFAAPYTGDDLVPGASRRTQVTVSGATLQVEVFVTAVRAPDGEQYFLAQLRELTPEVRVHGHQQPSEEEARGRWGTCRFDRRTGWNVEAALLALWGVEPSTVVIGIPEQIVPAAERAAVLRQWQVAVRAAGRHALAYSIVHPSTGDRRQFHCIVETVIDETGVLQRADATHVDVTDTVVGREPDQRQQAVAAHSRLQLIRRIGDTLAAGQLPADELIERIAGLATAALGDGVVLRNRSWDKSTVEWNLVTYPDDAVRSAMITALERAVTAGGPGFEGLRSGHPWPQGTNPAVLRPFDGLAHFMAAPVRHNGDVLGQLAVFRTDPAAPYQVGDEDLLQVLADAAGAVIAAARARQVADDDRDLRLAALAGRQQELLETLAGIETRERSMLAESIHDEPIQRIVAAMLRLDNLALRSDDTVREEMDRIAVQLEMSVGWLRNLIVVALSPYELRSGLEPALAALADGIFTGTPTVFTVTSSQPVPLSFAAREAAYRILREGLMNVRKHARATRVTLEVEERANCVRLTLTDNGVGAQSLDAGAGHFGIATMRARADAEGGVLTIESSPGHGTVVALMLPTGARRHGGAAQWNARAAAEGVTDGGSVR
ncbi:ATP-binding protein [Nakamurella sp. GG22]